MTSFQTNDRDDLPLAIIIGGSGGMGQACARRLAERHLVVLANRDLQKSEEVAADLRRDGAVAVPIACDVTDPDSVVAMVGQASQYGPVKVLAHVAGISPSMGDWQRIMSVNLLGTVRTVEAVLPVINAGGVAVLVSSIAAHMRRFDDAVLKVLDDPLSSTFLPDLSTAFGAEPTSTDAYSLSKLGEVRLARRMAPAFAQRNARIVSLSPGIIRTPMGALEFENSPGKRELFMRTPLAREGMLTEICDALEFLCSDRASFITGTDLIVDGGLTAAVEFGAAT